MVEISGSMSHPERAPLRLCSSACGLLLSPFDGPGTTLGAVYRRLSARISKGNAATATARRVADLFYTAARHGSEYVDPRGVILRGSISYGRPEMAIFVPLLDRVRRCLSWMAAFAARTSF